MSNTLGWIVIGVLVLAGIGKAFYDLWRFRR